MPATVTGCNPSLKIHFQLWHKTARNQSKKNSALWKKGDVECTLALSQLPQGHARCRGYVQEIGDRLKNGEKIQRFLAHLQLLYTETVEGQILREKGLY